MQVIWKGLKPLLGANRLGKLKLGSGAVELIGTPEGAPLLVAGELDVAACWLSLVIPLISGGCKASS